MHGLTCDCDHTVRENADGDWSVEPVCTYTARLSTDQIETVRIVGRAETATRANTTMMITTSGLRSSIICFICLSYWTLPSSGQAHLRGLPSSPLSSSSRRLWQEPPAADVAAPAIAFQFDEYDAGDVITSLGNKNNGSGTFVVQVSATKFVEQKGLGRTKAATVMIFDSTHPTGGDVDLGTPHVDFGGPGVGRAGGRGRRYANDIPRGNLLIISQDDDSSNPNDNRKGGIMQFDFTPDVLAKGLGLLDNEEGVKIELFLAGGGTIVQNVARGTLHLCVSLLLRFGNSWETSWTQAETTRIRTSTWDRKQ
jgi:hypothetical protein